MKLLVTAFEPYDEWETNSSWEALVELLKKRGGDPRIVTRRYPVDLNGLRERLEKDFSSDIAAAIHLGQSPGSTQFQLEAIALNVAGNTRRPGVDFGPIVSDGPVAFRSRFPLASWVDRLKADAIPACVSYHAGTFLCNAVMYLSHYSASKIGLNIPIGFVHVPLTPLQAIHSGRGLASMSTDQTARGIEILIESILNDLQVERSQFA